MIRPGYIERQRARMIAATTPVHGLEASTDLVNAALESVLPKMFTDDQVRLFADGWCFGANSSAARARAQEN